MPAHTDPIECQMVRIGRAINEVRWYAVQGIATNDAESRTKSCAALEKLLTIPECRDLRYAEVNRSAVAYLHERLEQTSHQWVHEVIHDALWGGDQSQPDLIGPRYLREIRQIVPDERYWSQPIVRALLKAVPRKEARERRNFIHLGELLDQLVRPERALRSLALLPKLSKPRPSRVATEVRDLRVQRRRLSDHEGLRLKTWAGGESQCDAAWTDNTRRLWVALGLSNWPNIAREPRTKSGRESLYERLTVLVDTQLRVGLKPVDKLIIASWEFWGRRARFQNREFAIQQAPEILLHCLLRHHRTTVPNLHRIYEDEVRTEKPNATVTDENFRKILSRLRKLLKAEVGKFCEQKPLIQSGRGLQAEISLHSSLR